MSDNKDKLTLNLAGSVKQNLSKQRSKSVKVEVKRSRLPKKSTPAADTNLEEQQAKLAALEKIRSEQATKRKETDLKIAHNIQPKRAEGDELPEPVEEETVEEEVAQETTATETSKAPAADNKQEPVPVPTPAAPKPPEIKTRAGLKIVKDAPKQTATQKNKKKIEKRKVGAGIVPEASSYLKGPKDKRRSKLTIGQLFNAEQGERMRSLASVKRQREKQKAGYVSSQDQEFVAREVQITEFITVEELAKRAQVRVQVVIKELMKMGTMARQSQEIDADTAELVLNELGHAAVRVSDSDVETILEIEITDEQLETRPPVVTIMGHVDHGKTSLLDAIRNTRVTSGEAGGITQHIGAYQAQTKEGNLITFIDTPGHAAFTEMRSRGAQVTDIVILVVAADDGIMPQTEEAIAHAKSAGVPIVVAINKIDKPEANPAKVKEALLSYELVPEEFGGDIQCVEVSAKEAINLDGLLETLYITAEMQELKAAPSVRAEGSVIEARMDKGRGVVATVLVQQGTLEKGSIVLAGTAMGKVRDMRDDINKPLKSAGPATPVEIIGLDEAPQAGDKFYVMEEEKKARDIIEYRRKKVVDAASTKAAAANNSIERLFKQAEGGGKELNVIIKGDVQGSIEAISGSLDKIENDEVDIKIVHTGVGGVAESDINLAAATNAIVLAFNVRSTGEAETQAKANEVNIHYYSIIYNLLDDVKNLVSGLMEPVIREEFIGKAEIQQVFKMSKYGKVAGCLMKEGVVKRACGVRLIRDNVVIHEGTLKTLRRFKDDVEEVKDNTECGMAFENYEDMKEGDIIECFVNVSERPVIE